MCVCVRGACVRGCVRACARASVRVKDYPVCWDPVDLLAEIPLRDVLAHPGQNVDTCQTNLACFKDRRILGMATQLVGTRRKGLIRPHSTWQRHYNLHAPIINSTEPWPISQAFPMGGHLVAKNQGLFEESNPALRLASFVPGPWTWFNTV